MYGIYGDIIGAAERALESFNETKELLEYPEVQADKAYYLSVLKKYNGLSFIKNKLDELKSVLSDERTFSGMLLGETPDSERDLIYAEISSLKRKASSLSGELSSALGCKSAGGRALCRFKFKEISSKFGVEFYSLLKDYLLSQNVLVTDEKSTVAKEGYVREISFIAEGADVVERLYPLAGEHKVYIAKAKSEELCFAVTSAPRQEEIDENDIKIEVFHSHGAGGQNINKVETAVRVIHLPTGISAVCQDERSQLKNKRRAIETLQKRLTELNEKSEKKRIEADICAQHCQKNTPLSFDAAGSTMTDTRLKAFNKISFPPTQAEFKEYMNGLIAL